MCVCVCVCVYTAMCYIYIYIYIYIIKELRDFSKNTTMHYIYRVFHNLWTLLQEVIS